MSPDAALPADAFSPSTADAPSPAIETSAADQPDAAVAALNFRLLQQFLAANDVRCPICRYNLHGLTSARCPECGHDLHLGVQPSQLRIGRLLACFAPLMMSFGTSVLLVLVWTANGFGGQSRGIFLTIAVLGLVHGLIGILLSRGAGLFLCASPRFQTGLVWIAWLLSMPLIALMSEVHW